MKRAIMVLAVSLLVGWTSAAAAECALVLWIKHFSRDIKPPKTANLWWEVDSAYETGAECIAFRDRRYAYEASVARAAPDTKDFVLNSEWAILDYTRQGTRWTSKFVCFPDTLDPREKKE